MGRTPALMSTNITENPYAFRNEMRFKTRSVLLVPYGVVTASYVGPKLSNSIPREYKECDFLHEFKAKIKTCYPQKCQ